jgi:hypothetical protein
VLKEIPLGIFVLTFNYCLRQNKGIAIYINTNDKKQLLNKPSLKEYAINSYKSLYIDKQTFTLLRTNKHLLELIGLRTDL